MINDANESLTITVEEAARLLGISRTLAYQAARSGEIPTIKVGRRILVPRAAFDRRLEEAVKKEDATE